MDIEECMNNEQTLNGEYFFVNYGTTKTAVCAVNLLWFHMKSYNITRYLLLNRGKNEKSKAIDQIFYF